MSDTYIGGLPETAPFRIGVVLSKTFAVFSGQLGKFLLLTSIPMIPNLAVSFLSVSRPYAALFGGLVSALTFFLQMLAQATTLYGAFQQMDGHSFTIGQSLAVGLRRVLPVFAVALCAGLAVGVGVLLLLIPGLIILCILYVAVPVCVIEKRGVMDSLNRSAALTKGCRWQILGLLVLVGVAGAVAQAGLSLIGGGTLWGKVLHFGWLVIATSFGAVLAAVAYHDLRVAKEGIAVDNLASIFD